MEEPRAFRGSFKSASIPQVGGDLEVMLYSKKHMKSMNNVSCDLMMEYTGLYRRGCRVKLPVKVEFKEDENGKELVSLLAEPMGKQLLSFAIQSYKDEDGIIKGEYMGSNPGDRGYFDLIVDTTSTEINYAEKETSCSIQ